MCFSSAHILLAGESLTWSNSLVSDSVDSESLKPTNKKKCVRTLNGLKSGIASKQSVLECTLYQKHKR